MRVKELIQEAGVVATPTGRPGEPSTPAAPVDPKSQDIGKLTASISSLQKQVQDLQKAAVQQSTVTQAQSQPQPGSAGQQQQAVGTTGSTTAPAAGQKPDQDAGMLDAIKKLAGVDKSASQTSTKVPAEKQMGQAPGVNQPPQVTNLKIKQQLAKSQGAGTP